MAGPLPRGLAWLNRIPTIGLALCDQAVVSGANFLHAMAAVRCLGVDDFAIFSLAWAVLMFMGNIHQAIILQPLAVLYAEHSPLQAKGYLHALDQYHVRVWLAVVPIVLVSWVFPSLAAIICSTTFAVLSRQAAEYERRVAYVLHDGARAFAVDVVTYGPLAAFSALLWLSPMPMTRDIFMIAAAIPSCMGWIFGRWLISHARVRVEGVPGVTAHWDFGKWALGSAMAQYAGNQLYPFLVAGFLSLREVAALALMRNLVGAINVVVSGIEAWWTPRARAGFVAGSWRGTDIWYRRLAMALLFGVTPILAVLFTFPEAIIRLVATDEYREFAWVLQVMSVIWLLWLTSRIDGLMLQVAKLPRAGTAACVLAAIATISIGPALVINMGMTGVLVGFASNVVMTKIILWHTLRKVRTHA